jgi:hypothetical protein
MEAGLSPADKAVRAVLGRPKEVLKGMPNLSDGVTRLTAATPQVKSVQDDLVEFIKSFSLLVGREPPVFDWLEVSTLLQSAPDLLLSRCYANVIALGAMHLRLIMDTTKVGKSLATGLGAFTAAGEATAREMVSHTFSELYCANLETSFLSQYADENALEFEKLLESLQHFPDSDVSSTDFAKGFTAQPGLDKLRWVTVSKSFRTTFDLLPPAGQALYVAATRIIAPPGVSASVAGYHRIQVPESAKARNAYRRFVQQATDSEDELIVWVARLSRLVLMQLALFKTLVELHNHCQGYPSWNAGTVPAFEVPSKNDLKDVLKDSVKDEARNWTAGRLETGNDQPAPVPSKPSSVPLTATDGMRFLESQMRNTSSNYIMPPAGSAQQKWINWFTTVEHFPQMFPTPDHIIIENLTTGIPDDDVRIYGWKTLCGQYTAQGQSWGLSEFLAHVRKQVLSTVTTRKTAWDELQALSQNYTDLADCVAFSARLRNLYQQIYDTSSTEVEPVSRVACIRCIHQLLSHIHVKGKNACPVSKAWKGFTQFQATELFLEYIHQDKHTPSETSRLSAAYLDKVCGQLTTAHDVYTQMSMAYVPVPQSQTPSRGSVNSMSQDKGKGKGKPQNSGRNAEKSKRSRSATRNDNPASRDASHTPTQRPRTEAAGTAQASTKRQDASFADCVKVLSRDHPDLAPPYLRKLAGIQPDMSHTQCLTAIRKGDCILCQQHDHQYGDCPLRKQGHPRKPEADAWMAKYTEARKKARQELNDAA